tara:strand:- start:583 stop:861 length:279 start_codon:yes stop_codon:yes gene_type:complete
MAGLSQLSEKIGLQPSKYSKHKQSLTMSLGQKLYDALGLKLSKEGVTFGEKGFAYSPISKKWEVSAWYKKKDEGKGFAGKDYNFGFSLGRKL